MRLFTSGISGFLYDQAAAKVAERLAEEGIVLDVDTVEARLSYLVEHGNLNGVVTDVLAWLRASACVLRLVRLARV